MKDIIHKILKADKIALFAHTEPDADALGSLFALCDTLKSMKKEVRIYLASQALVGFNFLGIKNVAQVVDFDLRSGYYDMLIALDTASPVLLGKFEKVFAQHPNTIAIDHHAKRIPVAKCEFVDTKPASCAEIVFELVQRLKRKALTPQVATALLCGIIGDTNRFLNTNTKPETLKAAAILVKQGADLDLINHNMYMEKPLESLRAKQVVIGNLKICEDIAYSFISHKEQRRLNIQSVSVSDLISLIISIKNIKIAFIVTEKISRRKRIVQKPKQGKKKIACSESVIETIKTTNVSLRSKGNFDVSKVAAHFGGGGHKNASGIKNLQNTIEGTCNDILSYIKGNYGEIQND